MAYLLFFGALFFGVFLYFLIQIRNFIAKERASENRIIANLEMLNLDAESLAKKNTGEVGKNEQSQSNDLYKSWGYPPEKEQIVKQIIPVEQVEDDWDYVIQIHERAEQYLGLDQFMGLEGRVVSIPGVEKCQYRERGEFLILSKSYSPEILLELFWKEFLHAAEIVSIKKNT